MCTAADLALAGDLLRGGGAPQWPGKQWNEPLCLRRDVVGRSAQQAERRQPLREAIGIGVEPQHGGQRRNRHLVHAERTLHRIALDLGDQIGAADDDAGLRPAQQLVAAERYQVGTRFERVAGRRLVWQSILLEVDQRAAAEIDHERERVVMTKCRQLALRHSGGKALDRIVAAVHLHDEGRPSADRIGKIMQMRAVRRSHFLELAPRAGHHIRYSKGTTDLDQLAARDRHLLAQREGIEHQEDGRCVVVHHRCGVRAGQPAQPVLDMRISVAPAGAPDVVFEIGG